MSTNLGVIVLIVRQSSPVSWEGPLSEFFSEPQGGYRASSGLMGTDKVLIVIWR